jgi:hypothetical protein
MPGHFGTTDAEDGLFASARTSAHVGVFGNNESLDAPTGGGAGGAGVFGLTNSPGAAGVFGANNGAKGVGVQGNGPEAGISGFSEKGVGLRAHSNHGDGTQSFAHSSDHNGLLGLNDATLVAPNGGAPAGNGVYGYTNVPNASGVCGAVAASNTGGAGVTGIGPVAGHFFGNVIVTGDITVDGTTIGELLRRITVLEQQASTRPGPGPTAPAGTPSISVRTSGSGTSTAFIVTGSGFLPNRSISIRIVDSVLNSLVQTFSSDAQGHLSATINQACNSGGQVAVSATDGRPNPKDQTGSLWSNTFTLPCP